MSDNSVEFAIFLIFTGAAVFATIALYSRLAIIVGYILLGMILGPWGLSLISDPEQIKDISGIGIIFLLYLLGLDLLPQQLMKMLGEAMTITIISSILFFVFGLSIGLVFGYELVEVLLIGATMMFSSTIIGLKLLPTTTLHHRHTGQIIISVLLIQDLIAIIVLLLLQGFHRGDNMVTGVILQLLSLPLLLLIIYLLEKFILVKLITRFDRIHEYIFLIAIGWCMGIAELASVIGLSHEIGAFLAGVALASSPIALFITERLKPLRDFFLVIFFFSLGAGFNMSMLDQVFITAIFLAVVVLVMKPLVFEFLLFKADEIKNISREVGIRLGQVSEFSLLITVLALESGYIGEVVSTMLQLTTLITFILSSYIIVLRYPTPIAISDRLRRD